jgi:hypothetical protein
MPNVPCVWVWGMLVKKILFLSEHKKLLIRKKEKGKEEKIKRSREVFINHSSTDKNVKIIKLNVLILPFYMCEFLIMYYFNYLKKEKSD